jgi:hypothetical protein
LVGQVHFSLCASESDVERFEELSWSECDDVCNCNIYKEWRNVPVRSKLWTGNDSGMRWEQKGKSLDTEVRRIRQQRKTHLSKVSVES